MKKILKYLSFILVIGILIVLYFSPYGKNEIHKVKNVYAKITITAPIDKVFSYMGNSEHAKDWSVYVDHITTISGNDGKVGCTRRCFTSKEESGPTWDEDIITVQKNKVRKLSIYKLENFPLTADYLQTEQVYRKLNKNKTELALILYFTPEKKWIDEVKMYFAAYKIKAIFKGNLKNIKREIEQNY